MTKKKAPQPAGGEFLDRHHPDLHDAGDQDDFLDMFADEDNDTDVDEVVGFSARRQSANQDDGDLEISFTDDSAGEDFSQDLLDPVKSYLREMGAVPLLSTAAETEIAIKIERGEKQIQSTLLSLATAMPTLIAIASGLRDGCRSKRSSRMWTRVTMPPCSRPRTIFCGRSARLNVIKMNGMPSMAISWPLSKLRTKRRSS